MQHHLEELKKGIGRLVEEKRMVTEYLVKYGTHLHNCATAYSLEESCTCGFDSVGKEVGI